jgi:hypothetical protein
MWLTGECHFYRCTVVMMLLDGPVAMAVMVAYY